MLYILYYQTDLSNKYIDFLIKFCNNKSNDDIICVVKNKNDLQGHVDKYYYQYSKTILFGIKEPNEDIFIKYLQNLIYGTWNNEMVQEDKFIGPVNLICDFWKDIGPNENIHKYVMRKMENQGFSRVLDYKYDLDYESNIFHKKIIKPGKEKVSGVDVILLILSTIYILFRTCIFIWKCI